MHLTPCTHSTHSPSFTTLSLSFVRYHMPPSARFLSNLGLHLLRLSDRIPSLSISTCYVLPSPSISIRGFMPSCFEGCRMSVAWRRVTGAAVIGDFLWTLCMDIVLFPFTPSFPFICLFSLPAYFLYLLAFVYPDIPLVVLLAGCRVLVRPTSCSCQ
jgi:hypothetical protein